MDQIQQSLCEIENKNLLHFNRSNILRAAIADYLPNNKLKQNLLLNAFDDDVVQS